MQMLPFYKVAGRLDLLYNVSCSRIMHCKPYICINVTCAHNETKSRIGDVKMLNLYNLLCLGYFIADINSTLTAINVTLRQILKSWHLNQLEQPLLWCLVPQQQNLQPLQQNLKQSHLMFQTRQ